jgi:hypothetical protein
MKKKKKQTYTIIYLIILLIIIGVVVFIISNKNTFYSIEDRTSQVEKEKKKDDEKVKTIGWIRVQGTTIDTPIVGFTEKFDERKDDVDRDDFLYNYEGEETLFNKANIMGHNILNLSAHPRIKDNRFTRFEPLMAFVYFDFAKDNKYIQYTIDGGNYLYKIYSVRLYKNYERLKLTFKRRILKMK